MFGVVWDSDKGGDEFKFKKKIHIGLIASLNQLD